MILITNDDGFDSLGIQKLYKVLNSFEDVVIVAPDKDYSGIGYYYTFDKLFNVKKEEQGLKVSGTPVDCVRLGIKNYKPDLIISGINKGGNIGYDTLLISGTFMSAYEGYKNGIKSLATSFVNNTNKFFYTMEDDIKNHNIKKLKEVINHCIDEDFKLANLNLITENYNDYEITNPIDTIYEQYSKYDYHLAYNIKDKIEDGTDLYAIKKLNKPSLSIIK